MVKRLLLACVLAVAWAAPSWAASSCVFIPADAWAVGGTGNFYGTATSSTLANGAPVISFADSDGNFATVDFWFPNSSISTVLSVYPWGQTNAAGGSACFQIQWEISPSALLTSATSQWNLNNAGDASPIGFPAVVSSTALGASTNGAISSVAQGQAYDQGNGGACTLANCAGAPGKLRLLRNVSICNSSVPGGDTGQPFSFIGARVCWVVS